MFYSLPTLLRVLAASAASIPFVAAQASETSAAPVTTDQLYAKISSTAAPAPGYNADGTSVFTNFVDAVNDGQFFQLRTASAVTEKPGSEAVQLSFLDWCSDLTFSDFSNSLLMGYAGRCVKMSHKQAVAKHTLGISAVCRAAKHLSRSASLQYR